VTYRTQDPAALQQRVAELEAENATLTWHDLDVSAVEFNRAAVAARPFQITPCTAKIGSGETLTSGGPIESGKIEFVPAAPTAEQAARQLVDRFLAQSTAMPDDVFRRFFAAMYAAPPPANGSEWMDPLSGTVWVFNSGGWTIKHVPKPAPEKSEQGVSECGKEDLGRTFACGCGKTLNEKQDTRGGDVSIAVCWHCGVRNRTGWK
jgi:hypothetical protein